MFKVLVQPVILCISSGTRLWRLSRKALTELFEDDLTRTNDTYGRAVSISEGAKKQA